MTKLKSILAPETGEKLEEYAIAVSDSIAVHKEDFDNYSITVDFNDPLFVDRLREYFIKEFLSTMSIHIAQDGSHSLFDGDSMKTLPLHTVYTDK